MNARGHEQEQAAAAGQKAVSWRRAEQRANLVIARSDDVFARSGRRSDAEGVRHVDHCLMET